MVEREEIEWCCLSYLYVTILFGWCFYVTEYFVV